MANGADIGINDYSAVYLAAQRGHLSIVKFYVEMGEIKNFSCINAILYAIYKIHLPVIEYLLKIEPSNIGNDLILYVSVINLKISVVQYLLENGWNINKALELAREYSPSLIPFLENLHNPKLLN